MNRPQEMHTFVGRAMQKNGDVSKYTIMEDDNKDTLNLAKAGKKQVLKVCKVLVLRSGDELTSASAGLV